MSSEEKNYDQDFASAIREINRSRGSPVHHGIELFLTGIAIYNGKTDNEVMLFGNEFKTQSVSDMSRYYHGFRTERIHHRHIVYLHSLVEGNKRIGALCTEWESKDTFLLCYEHNEEDTYLVCRIDESSGEYIFNSNIDCGDEITLERQGSSEKDLRHAMALLSKVREER